jgi:hypothetical protein
LNLAAYRIKKSKKTISCAFLASVAARFGLQLQHLPGFTGFDCGYVHKTAIKTALGNGS